MSKADVQFVKMCRDILDHGTTTEGEKVRPHWEDGTPAYTIKNFGVTARYDLREEFPALTLRRTALKSAMDEILWIYQKKSNNIHDLKSHIWDEWADETGSIGKAYGYQIAQKSHYPEGDFDQMDRVLYDLAHTPFSRRIMTNMYTFADLSEMHLYPCAYSVTYNVTHAEGDEKPTLNMCLMQRSQDILAANNWNVCQYAILLMMVAQVSGMVAGELITEDRGYADHIDLEQDLLKVAVIERHKNTRHIGVGYLKGYGLKSGAVATSVSHDSHNIIVVGASEADMAAAANRVAENRGGIVVVREGAVAAEVVLSIAGIMSDDTLENVNRDLEHAKDVAFSLGVNRDIDPLMTLSFMALPVIPTLRLTTRGVLDVNTQQYV